MFSTHKLWIATLALLGVFTAFSGFALAQKVGVVDGNKVLGDYSDAQKANTRLQDSGKLWQETIKKMTEGLQSKAEGFRKTYETMTKDAQAKAQGEVNAMQDEIQKFQNAKFDQNAGELAQLRQTLLKPILEKIKDVISSVAKKKEIDIIIDSQQNAIYVGKKVVDITSDVSAALK
jgi:Skp family chaperone for outer membrane proteins